MESGELQSNHRSYLRDFHEILCGKRSLARSAFDRLTPSQKRILLDASDITPHTSVIYNEGGSFSHTWSMDYDNLTDEELDKLKKGLRKLKSIINAFAICEQQDFIKERKTKF